MSAALKRRRTRPTLRRIHPAKTAGAIQLYIKNDSHHHHLKQIFTFGAINGTIQLPPSATPAHAYHEQYRCCPSALSRLPPLLHQPRRTLPLCLSRLADQEQASALPGCAGSFWPTLPVPAAQNRLLLLKAEVETPSERVGQVFPFPCRASALPFRTWLPVVATAGGSQDAGQESRTHHDEERLAHQAWHHRCSDLQRP